MHVPVGGHVFSRREPRVAQRRNTTYFDVLYIQYKALLMCLVTLIVARLDLRCTENLSVCSRQSLCLKRI